MTEVGESKYRQTTKVGELAIEVYENASKVFLATPDEVFDVSAGIHKRCGLSDMLRAANGDISHHPLSRIRISAAAPRDAYEFNPPGMTGYHRIAHMGINSVEDHRQITLDVDDMGKAARAYFGLPA